MQRRAIPALVVLLMALAAYSNTLHAPFVYDDLDNITLNSDVTQHVIFTGFDVPAPVKVITMPRYLGYASFALNHMIGGLSPLGYHIANLAIHLLSGLLVYMLCLRLLSPMEGPGARACALIASALFVLHPLQTQSVTYIVQRFTSLVALLYLGSALAYIAYRDTGRLSRYMASILLMLAALKVKETAVTIPVALAALEYALFRAPLRRRALLLLPFALATLIVPMSLIGWGADTEGHELQGETMAEQAGAVTQFKSALGRTEYALTQTRVLFTYLRLALLPMGQNLDYDYPAYAGDTRRAVLPAISLALMAAWGLLMLARHRGGGDPYLRAAGFGILFFFIAISVESSVIPISDVIAEQRMYLPLAGLVMAASALGTRALGALPAGNRSVNRAGAAMTLCLALLMAGAAYARNQEWRAGVSLWEDTALKSPLSSRVQYNLGVEYTALDRHREAIERYRRAIALRPDYAQAYVNMGIGQAALGMSQEAIESYQNAISIAPSLTGARYNLALELLGTGRLDEALRQCERIIELEPGNARAHVAASAAYLWMQDYPNAARMAQDALDIQASLADAHNNLGTALLNMGQTEEAAASYRRAVGLDPSSAASRFNLGSALMELGDLDGARRELGQALGLDPSLSPARELLERIGPRPGL